MPSPSPSLALSTALMARDDLAHINAAIRLRLPDRNAEARRFARIGQLLDASAALSRALAAYTRCARVNSRGTYGTEDLDGDADTLAHALSEYVALVRDVALEYEFAAALSPPAVAGTVNGAAAGRPLRVLG